MTTMIESLNVSRNAPELEFERPTRQVTQNRPADIGFSPEEREDVALKNYKLVHAIARKIHARLPPSVELDDLIHEGFIGLLEAMDRYDNYSRVPLGIFARQRITGAILDLLRDLDWVPRTVRRRAELLENTKTYLRDRLDRAPNREEVAAQLDVTPQKLDQLESSAEIRRLTSLDVSNAPGTDIALIECLIADDEDYVDERASDELVAAVLEAVERLPAKERIAVQGFYLEDQPLSVVGRELGVSESRASQLHRKGVKRLRYKVREHLTA